MESTLKIKFKKYHIKNKDTHLNYVKEFEIHNRLINITFTLILLRD